MIREMEWPIVWGETKKGWDSSAGEGKRKYDAGLQNKEGRRSSLIVIYLVTYLPVNRYWPPPTMLEPGCTWWNGWELSLKEKRKYLFTQMMWDLWDWLSWLAVWADSVSEGEGKFTNNSSVSRDWKHRAGVYPPMSPSYSCRPKSDARKIIYFNF